MYIARTIYKYVKEFTAESAEIAEERIFVTKAQRHKAGTDYNC